MVPSTPLGAMPQFRLCGQVGNAPTKMTISKIKRIMDKDMHITSGYFFLVLSIPFFSPETNPSISFSATSFF
jgi:hypothetical protein